MITTIATGITLFCLLLLMFIYIRHLIKVRSKYTVGLVVFALLFLIQNGISLYFFLTSPEIYVGLVGVHMIGITILEAIAFATLVFISWD